MRMELQPAINHRFRFLSLYPRPGKAWQVVWQQRSVWSHRTVQRERFVLCHFSRWQSLKVSSWLRVSRPRHPFKPHICVHMLPFAPHVVSGSTRALVCGFSTQHVLCTCAQDCLPLPLMPPISPSCQHSREWLSLGGKRLVCFCAIRPSWSRRDFLCGLFDIGKNWIPQAEQPENWRFGPKGQVLRCRHRQLRREWVAYPWCGGGGLTLVRTWLTGTNQRSHCSWNHRHLVQFRKRSCSRCPSAKHVEKSDSWWQNLCNGCASWSKDKTIPGNSVPVPPCISHKSLVFLNTGLFRFGWNFRALYPCKALIVFAMVILMTVMLLACSTECKCAVSCTECPRTNVAEWVNVCGSAKKFIVFVVFLRLRSRPFPRKAQVQHLLWQALCFESGSATMATHRNLQKL